MISSTTTELPTVARETIAKILQECRRLSRVQLYVRLRKNDLEQSPVDHEPHALNGGERPILDACV